MIFGKTRLELKVGVFVFIGAIILVFFILSMEKFKTWTSGYRLSFSFDFVNGVKLGAPVRFAGVDVGEVKKIDFVFKPEEAKTKIKIKCWVENKARIPQDSTVWVNTLGLLGEKYIEIIPGKDYNNCLLANQELVGVDPIPMHEITVMAKRIADNIDTAIAKIKNKEGTLGKLLYEDAIYNDLEALVGDLRKNPWKLFYKPPKEKK